MSLLDHDDLGIGNFQKRLCADPPRPVVRSDLDALRTCGVGAGELGVAFARRIRPFPVAMLAALAMFQGSGILMLIGYLLKPMLDFIGFPVDLLPLALMRPLSGSGSLGLLNEILTNPHSTESLKFTAAILYGSTETTFYVLAVYFGSVGIRKARHALAAGLIADLVGMTAAVIFGRLLFS